MENLKQFKPKNGERIILFENGEPSAVLISFHDYQRITQGENPEAQKEEKTDLTLEDLPF